MSSDTINSRLRKELERKKISQNEVAELIGVSIKTVNQILNDNRSVKAEYLEKLHETVQLDIQFVLTGVRLRQVLKQERERDELGGETAYMRRQAVARKRLKQARELANVSQEELAGVLALRKSSVSKWERGINKPDIDQLVVIAEYLGVSVEYLAALDYVKTEYSDNASIQAAQVAEAVDEYEAGAADNTPITRENSLELIKSAQLLLEKALAELSRPSDSDY